jgi:flagellar biosynthesis/type III secretory pathway chaperone
MSNHEQLGKSLLECLTEVKSLLTHAQSIAMKQQQALVSSDAEEIVVTTRAQEEILRRVGEADQRAAAIATELAQSAGLDSDTSDITTLAEVAGFPNSIYIKQEMESISSISKQVRRTNEVNQQLLQNGLEIITCCLRTVANDPGPASYGNDASFGGFQANVLSLDLRV